MSAQALKKTSNNAGRKPSLTPQIQANIVKLIQMGSYVNIAASAVGIGERTFYDWMAKGKEGKKPYVQFSQAIEKAKGECETLLLSKLMKAIDQGDWKAAAWMLERKYTERWGRPIQVDHTQTNNVMVLSHANIMLLLNKARQAG